MGERYLIMGTQIGMFQALARAKEFKEIDKLVEEIIDKQFIGRSENQILEDVSRIEKHGFKDPIVIPYGLTRYEIWQMTYPEFCERLKQQTKDEILKYLWELSIAATILITETDFFRGQKQGELLMIHKLKKYLSQDVK